MTRLTRKNEITSLLSQGLRSKEIARKLGISPSTVNVYVGALAQRECATRFEFYCLTVYRSLPSPPKKN